MSPRILVIGGAGYVGSVITKMYLEVGCTVMVFDDLSTGSLDALPTTHETLSFYKGSIANCDEVHTAVTLFQPEVVLHMAALHYIPDCINDPAAVVDTNIKGTLHIVDALNTLSYKPKLIFTSSAAVYGSTTPAPQMVSQTLQPCDIYGYSKMVGEHIVSSRYKNYIIVRLFNVYGDNDPTPHLIPTIIKQLHKKTVAIGSPSSQRDYVYVQDAARAFIALAAGGRLQKTYNVGSGVSYSVRQVADTIKKLSGSNADIAYDVSEPRAVDPQILCADISEITMDTSWRPLASFVQGLQSALDCFPIRGQTLTAGAVSTVTPSRTICMQDYIAVVSDFDDTILDNQVSSMGGFHEISRYEALREVSISSGVDLTANLTDSMYKQAIIHAPEHVSEGAFWWLLLQAGYFAADQPYDPLHPLIQQLTKTKINQYRRLMALGSKETPGAGRFFKALHDQGYAGRIAIASSARQQDICTFLRHHDLGYIFTKNNIIARENTTHVKPHPEVYMHALKNMRISHRNAHQVLAFEDDPRGIIAAKKAGLLTCALTTRFTEKELMSQAIKPDFVAQDFNEYYRICGLSATSVTLSAPIIMVNSNS